MQNAKEVKRRIRSVENTRQITKTMEMVATSKLKKATDRVRAAEPYSEALDVVVRSLYASEYAERFPMLRQPETVSKMAVVLMTESGKPGMWSKRVSPAATKTFPRESMLMVSTEDLMLSTWAMAQKSSDLEFSPCSTKSFTSERVAPGGK